MEVLTASNLVIRQGLVSVTKYRCDNCGTRWEYENDKTNQKAGWSVVGR